VGEHNAIDLVELILQIVEVGQDQIHARLDHFWKKHATVNNEDTAVNLEDGHIAAYLFDAAERHDA